MSTNNLVITSSNLYAAEEWEVIFNAFRKININPFDYHVVYKALLSYIKANNPEEFKQYTNNGVMKLHLELFSRLAHSLSYRYEKSTRENFFDTAENRESVIELARIFSYQPKRNRAANGQCKITGVRTTEPLLDRSGNSIKGTTVKWNHAGDEEWYDKFLRILNAAFESTNPFGRPLLRKSLYNVRHELYPINKVSSGAVRPKFKAKVNGRSMTFEAVSTKIEDIVMETTPNPFETFNVIYKNDSNGNLSPHTGFFVQFKQGELQNTDRQYTNVELNRTIDIDEDNINETDVWLTETAPDGTIKEEWTKIDSMEGQNLVYEKEFNNNDKLYTITSRTDNQITINFGDGNNTAIPYGRYRVWYRVSENETYIIRKNDIMNTPITIPYKGNDNQTYQLTIYLTNEVDIDNAESEESHRDIKKNAPLSHYTQERMINGEDYNVYPIIQTSLIRKTKTVNRTHQGHHRYTDIYDPSRSISKITMLASDGFIYVQDENYLQRFDWVEDANFPREMKRIVSQVFTNPNFITRIYHSVITEGIPLSESVRWKTLPSSVSFDRGYLTTGSNVVTIGEDSTVKELKIVDDKSILIFDSEFQTGIDYANNNGLINPMLATIGSIKMNDYIPDNSLLTGIIPAISAEDLEVDDFTDFETLMENRESFDLYYRLYDKSFTTVEEDDAIFIQSYVFDEGESFYRIQSPIMSYVVGSEQDISFFQKATNSMLTDPITGDVIQDYIAIGSANSGANSGSPTFLMNTIKTKDITTLKNNGE